MNLLNKIYERKIILIPFIISAGYWIYLFFFSQMSIAFDARNYEELAGIIHDDGWLMFFQTGPHREPFYPALISLSLTLSDLFNVPYEFFQKIIQVIFLFSTQVLTLVILRKANVHIYVVSAIILYLGISPVLVSSAFSLFSEIATYPFVLGTVIVSAYAWRLMLEENLPGLFCAGLGLSALFVVLALTKSVFGYIFLIFAIPFFLLFLNNIFKKDSKRSINSFVFLVVLFFGFYVFIVPYKSLNKRYNGNFAITDLRSVGILYGATTRRSQEFSGRKLQTFLASIPGEGVCRSIFDEQACSHWSFMTVDHLTGQKLRMMDGNVSHSAVREDFLAATREEFLKNPGSNILFIFLEGFKIFFWESTNAGFVLYPDSLTRIFHAPLFKNGLRLAVSLLTIVSVFYALFFLLRHRSEINEVSNSKIQVLLFSIILIFSFTGLYAVCYILIRYAFPIVPLFMICIAIFLDQVVLPVFQRKGKK